MSETAIRLINVSKRFKLYNNPITGPIKEILFFWNSRQYYQEFKAVKNVSLEIKKGEVVGIIGPNGAGKTTLLKMIAGLLPVDEGRIKINGKVTALLALGVGINPEFTGRENIFYSGLLLGMSKKEIQCKTPSIIEFAELGEYIDRPIRTYSSGMKARLLFATSMSIDPDILIVDEALATGDAYFVQKSSERIKELCESGATILFVSHNMLQIESLCKRALLLVGGQLIQDGEPSKVISEYHRWFFDKEKNTPIVLDNKGLHMANGTGEVIITDIKLKNGKGEEAKGFYTGEEMNIELCYKSFNPDLKKIHVAVKILYMPEQLLVAEVPSNRLISFKSMDFTHQQNKHIDISSQGKISFRLNPLLLLNNHYSLTVVSYDETGTKIYFRYPNISSFFVGTRQTPIPKLGFFRHPAEIQTE